MKQNDPKSLHTSASAPAIPARMNAGERRACVALAGIFALRMLGLFMIFPVFALHADRYAGNTPLLTGVAIAAYGLTQALFQIPFGALSDRIGRKRVITAGLAIFALGAVVAALADSITCVIAGRALQGMGAIAAAVMALAADLTREEHRTKAMGIIGVSIGGAFALALVVGPLVTSFAGLPGLFWLTAVLSPASACFTSACRIRPRATYTATPGRRGSCGSCCAIRSYCASTPGSSSCTW